jgi:predicted alpha-1,2-mannosidase
MLVLIYPEIQRDMNTSLEAMTIANGLVPKWPLATGETNTMIAYHGESVLVDAYTKGVGGFDAERMFAFLAAKERDCSPGYRERGWCGAEEEGGATSKTLENAFGEFVLARFADAVGEDASPHDARAGNWKNVFDESVGVVRGRSTDGSWIPDFSTEAFTEDLIEGNSRQWTPFVPHDPKGLAAAMGGDDQLVAFLAELFESAAAAEDTPLPDLWYWHGNEPDIHAAYMFAEVGRPDLTRKWADWVRRDRYTAGPDGLDGNDDGGTLSAWYVFAALGLFPKIAEGRYVLGSPLFPEVEVDVEGGTLRIVAENWAPGRYVVDRITFDGVEVEGPYVDHETIARGGTLVFELSTGR